MGGFPYEFKRVADGEVEGFCRPDYECWLLFLIFLRNWDRNWKVCVSGDLSVSDSVRAVQHLVERARRTLGSTNFLREFLADLDLIILGLPPSAERDRLRTRYVRYIEPIVSEGPFSFQNEPCSVEEFYVSSSDGMRVGDRNPDSVEGWDSLPKYIQENILQRVDFENLFRLKAVSKNVKKFIEDEAFRQARGGVSEGEFTAINYFIRNGVWRCSGYDLHSKSWRTLPPLSYLPPPDPELSKEYSVCGHGGLMCAEVSKLPNKGQIVVFNPLTGKTRALPPLLYPRNPVLVHISVDSAKGSYKVIVAGSFAASDEHLSKKVEVFDSSTSKWKEASDLPGPAFGLNKHQAGVCLNGKLFLISFLKKGCRMGVVAFDLQNEKWLQDLTTPIPWSSDSNTLQLVVNDEKLFLFSEKETNQSLDHCIHELEFPDPEAGVLTCQWSDVLERRISGGRGLLVYPEYTCVAFGEGELCIFNTINRDGVVYDMRDGTKCGKLERPPANQTGDNFFSLNPASFTLEPNFDSDPSFPVSLSSESQK